MSLLKFVVKIVISVVTNLEDILGIRRPLSRKREQIDSILLLVVAIFVAIAMK